MHTHGTAVLDRPAEATTPAQASQSAPGVGACAPGLEPARSTDDAAKALASRYGDVYNLEYGELAVALKASGVHPQRFRSADHAQLMEWAAQGLSLLGIDRIRHYHQRTRHLNIRSAEHRLSADDKAEYARMWSSHKTADACHDAAWCLLEAGLIGSHTILIPQWDEPATPAGARFLLTALDQRCLTCGAPAGHPCRPECDH